ncbi:hypothetical protein [Xanthomonas vesicatoria]|uniref:hypothetical protein n=1 Tax=Xanthomonas vesicatoria TaxID=56460 RepID=UPI0007321D71|nr:hypothetical protein [Xanthomonas vesicatoria]KTF38963.1 hypothetical protein LMG919_00635 [Xanthomonas vesicatoria]MCC8559946.1 hypothetical protein [Xanthomonas vesicatoria]MCC8602235.1 hypothetical protein [Xanthomonas vesicatoria]MCC8611559.1 hypothetical protein [Xanthomonas vesicatoria]MCC8673970.1 hypothetical protein [Xanthomonas vesicatoria]
MLSVHKGLAVTLLMAVFCTSAIAEDGISGLAMDEIVGKIYDPGKSVNYEIFRQIGLSDFHQVSSSRSLNIAFRSNTFKTRDQYAISFVEFRVPPELDKGVSFMYMELAPGRCYEVSKIKQKFALTPYVLPPNPHAPLADVSKDVFYKTDLGETSVYVKASSKGGCLLGLTRSRN